MKTELVSPKELQKAKKMLENSLVMGLETSDQNADFYVGQEIFEEEIKTPAQLIKEIRNITDFQVRKLAKEIFTKDNLYLAVVGPNHTEAQILPLLEL